jgi:hypothetical protein
MRSEHLAHEVGEVDDRPRSAGEGPAIAGVDRGEAKLRQDSPASLSRCR